MQITIHMTDAVQVIELAGDLDGHSAASVESSVASHLRPGDPLLLDLSAVPYASSAGLRALLLIYRYATESTCPTALVGLTEGVRDVLVATGFLSYFTVCATQVEGFLALQQAVDGAA